MCVSVCCICEMCWYLGGFVLGVCVVHVGCVPFMCGIYVSMCCICDVCCSVGRVWVCEFSGSR